MIKFKPAWPPKDSFHAPNQSLSSILVSIRLEIRPPTIEDYAEWKIIRQKNRKFLTPYEPQWPVNALSEDFFKRRLINQDQMRQAKEGAYFYLCLKGSGQIIGGLNLNNIQWGAARHATLGYWLGKEYEGQGYMIEAVREIIHYSFHTLKLRRLNAACLPENIRSINMLERAGFVEEGYAQKYLQINGRWQDHKLYGLCRPADM